MEIKELEKNIKRYEKLADKNYYLYQQTGEPRYDRAYQNYSELAQVHRMAYKYKIEEDDERTRRLRNMSVFIKEHIEDRFKEQYTKNEVIELAERMKQFAL